MDTSSGKLKETTVDQVDGMETTLAHLFPEMTANIVTPVLTVVSLLILDWRLALVRVVIQHLSKNTVISMVLGHPNSEITCIPPS